MNLGYSSFNMSRQRTKLLESLPGNRLPTTLQVLQRFEWIRKSNSNSENNEIIDLLIEEILVIWNKAYIPTMVKRNIKTKLQKILKKYKESNDQTQGFCGTAA